MRNIFDLGEKVVFLELIGPPTGFKEGVCGNRFEATEGVINGLNFDKDGNLKYLIVVDRSPVGMLASFQETMVHPSLVFKD